METNNTNSSSTTPSQQHPNHNHHQQRDNKTDDENVVESTESSSTSALNSTTTTSGARITAAAATTTTTSNSSVVYDVEHLATFSTSSNQNTSGSHETTNNGTNAARNSDYTNDDNSNGNNSKAETGIGKGPNDNATPKVALQRLFELEKLSGIWTQHMQIELRDDFMLIVDCETNSTVEQFNRDCVTRPEAFNHYNDIYNNIVVFIIQQPNNDTNRSLTSDNNNEKVHKDSDIAGENYQDYDRQSTVDSKDEGELHIFQCVSHKAQQLVSDILNWKSQRSTNKIMLADSSNDNNSSSQTSVSKQGQKNSSTSRNVSTSGNTSKQTIESKKSAPIPTAAQGSGKPVVTVASSTSNSENVPIVNVNVKETVQVFNQIAALREKSKPSSPVNHARPLSDASGASITHSTPLQGSISVSATNGAAHELSTTRPQLSPSNQLYKQRSIRATLAPKYASSGSPGASGHPSPTHSTTKMDAATAQQAPSSNNSGSAASSSSSSMELTEAPKLARYQVGSPSRSRHQSETDNVRGGVDPQHATTKQSDLVSVQNPPSEQHKVSKSKAPQQPRTQSNSSHSHASSSSQSHLDQVTTNESYVSVLNHCFDDIEKFIIRLQQAVAAIHELQAKRKLSKRAAAASQTAAASEAAGGGYAKGSAASGVSSPPMSAAELAMLNSKARGPSEDDYFEILSKFKLAFNLLAKLKGCIHEPNAPELVHFLFTPLAIIIESARNAMPPIDPTLVGIPYLNQDALDLLSNCCTSKESDMWISLGPNWTQTIDMNLLKASRLPSSFQPIFSDGWAPIIGELELIGLVAPPNAVVGSLNASERTTPVNQDRLHHSRSSHDGRRGGSGGSSGRAQQPTRYMLDEVEPLPANSYSLMDHSSYSNGKAGGKPRGPESMASSHAISGSRSDYKRNVPLPMNNNRHPLPGGGGGGPQMRHMAPHQPYVDHTVPYGYPLDDHHHQQIMDPPGGSDMHSQRRLGGSRNIRFSASDEGQLQRRIKPSSRYSQDYSMPSNYDTSHYPSQPIHPSLDHHEGLDVDLLAHQDGGGMLHHHHHHLHHPNDYSELQEHYQVDDGGHNPKGLPGPSHQQHLQQQHYRAAENGGHNRHVRAMQKSASSTIYNRPTIVPPFETDYMSEADHEAMLLDLGPAQTEWFFELQSRGAMIVRVLFTREANNEKELSVRRGEILEVLDDTRKWWRARNIDLQVAHVPHTIVAVMEGYQTLDELLANSPGNMDEPSLMNAQSRFSRRNLSGVDHNQLQWQARDEKRNTTAGAFRYF